MKTFAFITYILLFPIGLLAQNQQRVEELKKQLSTTKSVESKAELYNQLAQSFFGVNTDSVVFYADKNIELGIENDYKRAKALGYGEKGGAYVNSGRPKEAMKLLFKGLELREEIGEKKLVASVQLDLGTAYFNIGVDFENQDDSVRADSKYRVAYSKYNEALKIAIEANDSLYIARAHHNIASALFRLYNYKKSISEHKLSYQWFPAKEKESMAGELNSNIAACYIELEKYKEALPFLDLSILLHKKYNKYAKWASANFNLAAMVWKSNPQKAKFALMEADSLGVLAGDMLMRTEANLSLYEWHKEHDNSAEALEYYEQYTKLNAQIFNTETESQIKELDLKYNNEKTEKELAEEKAENEQERSKRKLMTMLLFGMFFVLIVLGVLFIQRRRIARLERTQEREQHHQEIGDLLKNQEQESMEAMFNGQEVERKRIAEDLHDRLGSTLSAARMHFEAAGGAQVEGEKKYGKAYELLDKAIDDTRGIAHNLVSGTLSKFGLFAALKDLKNTVEGTGKAQVEYTFKVKEERLQPEVEINLYRIVQEVFSNALKYANASILSAVIEQTEEKMIIELSDNGNGFDRSRSSHGMGLKNIEARVAKLNGVWELTSQLGQGTTHKIEISIKENGEKDNYRG